VGESERRNGPIISAEPEGESIFAWERARGIGIFGILRCRLAACRQLGAPRCGGWLAREEEEVSEIGYSVRVTRGE
jgi:hypothetical protein